MLLCLPNDHRDTLYQIVGSDKRCLPKSSSLTSLAAFSPSSRRFLSIILDLSAAALSSALTVQPMAPRQGSAKPFARQKGSLKKQKTSRMLLKNIRGEEKSNEGGKKVNVRMNGRLNDSGSCVLTVTGGPFPNNQNRACCSPPPSSWNVLPWVQIAAAPIPDATCLLFLPRATVAKKAQKWEHKRKAKRLPVNCHRQTLVFRTEKILSFNFFWTERSASHLIHTWG